MKEITTCYSCVNFFLFCFFALFFPYCESIEDEEHTYERSFYSISSLCFHLDGLVSEETAANSNEEEIFFNDAEVVDLWHEAGRNPSFQLCRAQHYYYQAKGSNDRPMISSQLYAKSKNLLDKIWKKLDAKLLGRSIPDTAAKKLIDNHYRALTYPHLENNPGIDNDMAKIITPFLMPVNHPIKQSLDKIFETSRAIRNEKSFDDAGFNTLFIQNLHSFIRVAKHDALPGYLLKVYLDSEPNKRAKKGWEHLSNRCEGAENVRQLIKSKKIVNFTVPDKWLYVLPPNIPSTSKDQPVLLIVTDMNLVSDSKTEEAWKTKATHELLDELYCIISHGYGSSGLIRNVPYTKDKIFTFIDTEKPKKTPNYSKARHYLSHEMRAYWDSLVKTGGKRDSKKKR